jgi:thioredoxin reductase
MPVRDALVVGGGPGGLNAGGPGGSGRTLPP